MRTVKNLQLQSAPLEIRHRPMFCLMKLIAEDSTSALGVFLMKLTAHLVSTSQWQLETVIGLSEFHILYLF